MSRPVPSVLLATLLVTILPAPAFALPRLPGILKPPAAISSGLRELTSKLPELPGSDAKDVLGILDPKELVAYAAKVAKVAKLAADDSPVLDAGTRVLELSRGQAGAAAVKGLQTLLKVLRTSPVSPSAMVKLIDLPPFRLRDADVRITAPGCTLQVTKKGRDARCVVRVTVGDATVVFGHSSFAPLSSDLPDERSGNPFRAPVTFLDVSRNELEYLHLALPVDAALLPVVKAAGWFGVKGHAFTVKLAAADRDSLRVGLSASVGAHVKTCVPPNPVLFGLGGNLALSIEADPTAAADLLPKLRDHLKKTVATYRPDESGATTDDVLATLVRAGSTYVAGYKAPEGHELGRVGFGVASFVEGGVGEWDTTFALLSEGAAMTFWVPLQGLGELGRGVNGDLVRALREAAFALATLATSGRPSNPPLYFHDPTGQRQQHELTDEERSLLQRQLIEGTRTVLRYAAPALGRVALTSSLELAVSVNVAGSHSTSSSSKKAPPKGPTKSGLQLHKKPEGSGKDSGGSKAGSSITLFAASATLPVGEAAKRFTKGDAADTLVGLLAELRSMGELGFDPKKLAKAGRDSLVAERLTEAVKALGEGTELSLRCAAPAPPLFWAVETTTGVLLGLAREGKDDAWGFFSEVHDAARTGSMKKILSAIKKSNPFGALLTSQSAAMKAFREDTSITLGVGAGVSGAIGAEVELNLGLGTALGLTFNPEMLAAVAGGSLGSKGATGRAVASFNVVAEAGPGLSLGEGVEFEAGATGSASLDVLSLTVAEYDGPLPQSTAVQQIVQGATQVVQGTTQVAQAAVQTTLQIAQGLFGAGKSVKQVLVELRSRGVTNAAELASLVWQCNQRNLTTLVAAFRELGYSAADIVAAVRTLQGVTASAVISALSSAGAAAADLLAAAQTLGGTTAGQVIRSLRQAGVSIGVIGQAFRGMTGVTVGAFVAALKGESVPLNDVVDAVRAFGVTSASELATAMKAAAYSAIDVCRALRRFGVAGLSALAGLLHDVGFSALDVTLALKDAGAASASAVAQALKTAGFAASEIGQALRDSGTHGASVLAGALKDAGFAVVAVAAVLKDLGFTTASTVAQGLKEAGFGFLEVVDGLRQIGQGSVGLLVDGLRAAGATTAQVLSTLASKGVAAADAVRELIARNVSPDDLMAVLKTSGTTALPALAAVFKGAGMAVGPLVSLLKRGGSGAVDIASALAGAGWSSLSDLASALKDAGFGVTDLARALKSRNASATQVVAQLRSLGFTAWSTLASALKDAGFDSGDVAKALKAAGASASDVASALKGAGWTAWSTLASALKSANFSVGDVASALKFLGASAYDVACALKDAGWTAWTTIASALKSAGFSAGDVASALKRAGAGVKDIAKALKSAGWSGLGTIKDALSSAGFGMGDMKDALSAVGASWKDLLKLF